MGRKKKATIKIEPKKETSLKYEGNVTISLLKKGKVIKRIENHNNGNNNLFKFILNCLAGEYYDSDRPKWIIPYYTDGENDKYSIASFIPINSIQIINNNNNTILAYKCLISAVYLPSNKNTKINGLLFYSDNGKKISGDSKNESEIIDSNFQMQMDFGNIDQTSFKDVDLLIEWQVRIVSAIQDE